MASFAVSLLIFFGYKEWSFYSPISRAWELLAGGIVANHYVEAPEREERRHPQLDNVLATVGWRQSPVPPSGSTRTVCFPAYMRCFPCLARR